MLSLHLTCEPAFEDELTAQLWEAGTAGISEEPGGIRAFFEDDAHAPALLARFAQFAPVWRNEPTTDWERVARESFPPILTGSRFFLVPPWSEAPTPAGRLRLEINPGMACGTGWHAATQLCLTAMERYVKPGSTVLDVGTGSGILSTAAQLLGAERIVACDIDHDAVIIAREHTGALFFTGSADAVRSRFADVIVANISSEAVELLATEFERVRKPGSALIVSGFPEWDEPRAFAARERLQQGEWVCLIC